MTKEVLDAANLTYKRHNDTHVILFNRSEYAQEEEMSAEPLVAEFK